MVNSHRMGRAWLISPMSLDASKSTFSPFQDLVKNFKSRPAAALKYVGESDGKEIFFISLDGKLMAAPVKLMPNNGSIEFGTPQPLFMTRVAGGALPGLFIQQYSASADGQRFLINVSEGTSLAPINVIYNWKPKGVQ
jgi:hypothetical protein